MKIKALFIMALCGIIAGIISAIIYNEKATSLPPIGSSYNPYEAGVYATGIIESFQPNGSNINIFPEVSGRVTKIWIHNGEAVKKNMPLLSIDDSVQKEIVEKDIAQINYANENLIGIKKQWEKVNQSYILDKRSVSKTHWDDSKYAAKAAEQNLNLAKASYASDKALLDKYTLKSSTDGIVFRVSCSVGDYTSPQGSYDVYTQNMLPPIQMGVITPYLQVRAFVDEILVPQLPRNGRLVGTLFIRGMNNKHIPLEFMSIQPYTIPNIELSNQRNQKIDVRVLPIIFKFKKPDDINIFPGQLVDVYLKAKSNEK